jgi:flavin-dependent dehydrogenase
VQLHGADHAEGIQMPKFDYDIVVVGGGLGGSALAKVMAGQGARVLVVERELRFKDRIRGE